MESVQLMKKILFTFPGQGVQSEGFLHHLPDFDPIKQTLEEASSLLGENILNYDTKEKLNETYWVQITLFVAEVALARFLIEEGINPDGVLGFSLGSYSSAVVAQSLSFKDALSLLQTRATLMQNKYPTGYGMASIIGLRAELISSIVKETHTNDSPVYIANFNCPVQLVISGKIEALQNVLQKATQLGASKTKMLAVRIPSHCPLLQDCIEPLEKKAHNLIWKDPVIPFFSPMFSRALYSKENIFKDLTQNLAFPLNFFETGLLAYEKNFYYAVEVGPLKVLTNLFKAALGNSLVLLPISELKPQFIVDSLKAQLAL
jgi:malonate decarboxylase epsilon subunit